MSRMIENRAVPCNRCGYGPVQGRESTYKGRRGETIHECRWICPRCNSLVRVDERVEEPPQENK